MPDNFYEQERNLERGYAGESVGRYTAKTFRLMFLGLLVTFAVAFLGYYTGAIIFVFYYSAIPVILLIAQLAVAIGMTAAIHKISAGTATAFFFLYAVLTGVTFSTYFLLFDLPSLILVFAATALYFGGMAVFGYFTDMDLFRLRNLLLGGVIFLIVMNVILMFVPYLETIDRVACTVGVVIFLLYTAYDTKKIKAFYDAFQADEAMLQKASVYSALELYLDFVNLFVYLLRLFGRRKN